MFWRLSTYSSIVLGNSLQVSSGIFFFIYSRTYLDDNVDIMFNKYWFFHNTLSIVFVNLRQPNSSSGESWINLSFFPKICSLNAIYHWFLYSFCMCRILFSKSSVAWLFSWKSFLTKNWHSTIHILLSNNRQVERRFNEPKVYFFLPSCVRRSWQFTYCLLSCWVAQNLCSSYH